ncbi:hypothetical protein JVU11DRAFT_10238 [Chiua virens]|nr:hypothetical protein JVU11DRAFT_10238 [Chiua virens]
MLSAVAARKAAKAAAEASITPSSKPPSPPLSKSLSPSPKPASSSNDNASSTVKRKPRGSSNTGQSKNKKTKLTHASTKFDRSVRYFDASDASKAQNTVDTAIGTATSQSESSSSAEEMEMDISHPAGLSFLPVKKTKRAWSPSRPMPDSSDEEEADPPGSTDPSMYLASVSKKFEPLPLSTFRPVIGINVYSVQGNEYETNGAAVILVLQPNETAALVGIYSLCVLQGSLSLLGVTLSPSNTKHAIFAPRSSPIPILSWAKLDRQGSCAYPIPLAIRRQENSTAILIEYAHTGVEGLGQICKTFENVFQPPRESEALPSIELPRIHIVNRGAKDIYPYVFPSSWETACSLIDEQLDSEMTAAPVCLVKGPRKSGKSTLARTLVNRLLNRYRRVAFLECDLGQSEFTPGGLVALNLVENYVFGPPFTHPSLPYRSHYIGSTSPRASPSHYLHSVQSLLEVYKLDLQFPVTNNESLPGDERIYDAIPLVVNTMGWTRGLGTDLNARIENFVEPSHTFDIVGVEEKGWPAPPQPQSSQQALTGFQLMPTNIMKCVTVESITSETTNTHYTATDHRNLNILSYFHAVFPEIPISSSGPSLVLNQVLAIGWDTSVPLCARYPYEVDYSQAFDHVYLTGPGYEDVVPSELTRVLNGAIVGLVSSGPASKLPRPTHPRTSNEETSSLPYTPAEPPPDPALSTCHGLALIRGIPLTPNPRSPRIHILTPLPPAVLAHTRVLVKGEMELPIWGMLDFREDDHGRVAGIDKDHVPYLQWGKGEGVGGEKRRVRRNLLRKGQM